jgi:hypothetical protein
MSFSRNPLCHVSIVRIALLIFCSVNAAQASQSPSRTPYRYWFLGTGGNIFYGNAGNDVVVYNGGNDYFDGGAGTDVMEGFGLRRQYTTSVSNGDVHINGSTTHSVERVKFADGTYVTDVHDTAAQVYRLYNAVLDRNPENAGLKNWDNALQSGTSLQTVVNGFTGSAEFQLKYGNVDNTQFATLLYNNVLDWAPDAGGLAHWVGSLNAGLSRSEAVLGFSESVEHIEKTRAGVEAGLWLRDDQTAMVARMYDTVLDRQGDAGGIMHWTNAFKSGMSLQAMADDFTGSAEFQAKYGNVDNTQFTTLLYNNVLDRAPDAGGLVHGIGSLNAGLSRSEAVLGFSESAEHQIKLAGVIDDSVFFV